METLRFPRLTFDRQALELVALFVVVLGATAALASQIPTETASSVGPPEQFGDGAQGEATAGIAWAIAEVVFAALMVGLLLAYKRLPETIQDVLRTNGLVAGSMYLGVSYAERGLGLELIAVFVVGYTAYRILDHFGLYWLLNNCITIATAVVGGIMIGMLFGVPGMALGLVGLTAYDHLFANKRSWMFTLGKGIIKLRLPVLFLRPDSLRVHWDEVVASMDPDSEGDNGEVTESETAWGLGTADMMLPAGFVAAVVTTPTDALLVGGVLAGVVCIAGALVACCRLRFEMLSRGSGAGLPALSAGVLVPYVALAVVATLV